MSNAPFYAMDARKGKQFGTSKLEDSLVLDGLSDAWDGSAMGLFAEKTADDFGITRELNDEYAIRSYERALDAIKSGRIESELVSLEDMPGKEKLGVDEEPLKFKPEKMSALRPAFSKTGTITAANASKINDGACTLILMSEEALKKYNVKPLARIVSYADAEV